mmetsp:Transcript_13616/g.30092  ORF Transcript_13616/g.30092 Transcript_13616/m.30092 type:complete len:470 (+) Transcript_13616:519-1928(+)
MALGCNQLWGEVVGGTAGGVAFTVDDFRQAHVRELHTALVRQQQVLRFQVAENDLPAVQMFEGQDGARHIELGARLVAPHVALVVRGVKFTPQGQLQEQVQVLGAVIGLVKLDDEGTVAHQLDVLLTHDAALHAALHHESLAQGFQCIHIARLGLFHQLHGAKAAAAQQAQLLQILELDIAEAFGIDNHFGLSYLGHHGRTVLATLHQLREGTQHHLKAFLVHKERLGAGAGDLHRGGAGLLVLQCLLSEVGSPLSRGRQAGHFLAILDDCHRALHQQEELGANFALFKDRLILGEGHFHHRLCELLLLRILQGSLEHFTSSHVVQVLLHLGFIGFQQNFLELMTCRHEDHRILCRSDGRCAWSKVEQRQLTEASTRLNGAQLCRGRSLQTGAFFAVTFGLRHGKAALLHDVEIVRLQIVLFNQSSSLGHVLLPHHVTHGLHSDIIEVGDGVQVHILLQRLLDQRHVRI